MSNNTPPPLPNNRIKLARMYGVSYNVFISWIAQDAILITLLLPFKNKRTLPPIVVKKIIESLGEP